jgi:rubredoxin
MNRLLDDAKLECRICWYVYDPENGDDVQQITPGTPFLKLPDYWRCPECDSAASSFLPVEA